MKRNIILVYALLSMLIASTAGTGLVSFAKANFEPVQAPSVPITDKPTISLTSPSNWIIQENHTDITVNVTLPSAWNDSYGFEGEIYSINCSLDQTQITNDVNTYGRSGNFPLDLADYTKHCCTIIHTEDVGLLSLGQHSVTVSVVADTMYYPYYPGEGHDYLYYDVSTSVTFTFTVVALPVISNLSVDNKTYSRSFLPLTFNLNQTTSWLGYSLDNHPNETISGNVTLTNLTEGNHNLVVYANDTYGNMGKSDTAYFTVSLPTPSPNLTETPTPSSTIPEFPLAAITITCLTATILVGAIFRTRKRRL